MYTTKQHAENGIRAIKDESDAAEVVDQTAEQHHEHSVDEHHVQQV